MDSQKHFIQNILKKFSKSNKDTGGSEVQIAILTERIKNLTEHFKIHKKDFHSRRGLMRMVSLRKKLLTYIKTNDPQSYQKTISQLSLRK